MTKKQKRKYYKLWDECLKGNSKPISDALANWSEEDKLEMFYYSFVNRYSKLSKEKWDEANTKYKYHLYFEIFEKVAQKGKFGRFLIRLFK